MSRTGVSATAKFLIFSVGLELTTGAALLIAPVLVTRLLLGPAIADATPIVARIAGIGLIALGLACWPERSTESHRRTCRQTPAFRALLVYNGLAAGYLTALSLVHHVSGVLLWPAVAIHAIVAGGLLTTRRLEA